MRTHKIIMKTKHRPTQTREGKPTEGSADERRSRAPTLLHLYNLYNLFHVARGGQAEVPRVSTLRGPGNCCQASSRAQTSYRGGR